MRSWCQEFGGRNAFETEFSADVQNFVPPEIRLCLFRILQEALHNAAKHSGAKRVAVHLREEAGEIHLIVTDFAKGFDIAAATQRRGLGLTSMQERARLAGGTIVIDTKPLVGRCSREWYSVV